MKRATKSCFRSGPHPQRWGPERKGYQQAKGAASTSEFRSRDWRADYTSVRTQPVLRVLAKDRYRSLTKPKTLSEGPRRDDRIAVDSRQDWIATDLPPASAWTQPVLRFPARDSFRSLARPKAAGLTSERTTSCEDSHSRPMPLAASTWSDRKTQNGERR